MGRRTATDTAAGLRGTARQLRGLSTSTRDQWLASALDVNAFHVEEDGVPVNVDARDAADERIGQLTRRRR